MLIEEACDVPRIALRDDSDEVLRLIRALQVVVLKNPGAAQSVFSAFVAEGKRFAETENGAEWKERLTKSSLFQRAQNVFQCATLWMLEDEPSQDLPSAYLDAVFMMAESPALEVLLQNLLSEDRGDDEPVA